MHDFVVKSVAQFKVDGNFANLTDENARLMGLGKTHTYSLDISYRTTRGARTVSYIYTVNEDTGGAHGNTTFQTFTFDTQTGANVALKDLFVPGAPYLATLSSLSRAKLPAILGDMTDTQMLTDGTTPDETNFANFYIENSDFVLLFSPYQVAAYAAGPQTLRIPLSDLSHILKPEYK